MSSPDPESTTSPEQVRSLLASDNFGDRIKGVNLLRDLDPKLAFEMIAPHCDDPNTRVRYAAVSQISELGKQDLDKAYSLLSASLGDPEPDVQAAAADSLGALKLTAALEDLHELYNTTSEWLVQMSVVACLGEMGDPGAFDLLKSALGADNGLVSVSAIGALGELNDERAIPLLLPYATDADWQTRHRTAQALGHFAKHPDVHQALQTLANDTVDIVAETAKMSQTAS